MAKPEIRIVVVPEGLELTSEDVARLETALASETIETLAGERALLARAQEKTVAKTKEEIAKEKELPFEKAKVQ